MRSERELLERMDAMVEREDDMARRSKAFDAALGSGLRWLLFANVAYWLTWSGPALVDCGMFVVDARYIVGLALLIVAVTWFCARLGRNGNSTGAWEGATSTRYEGMAPLGEPWQVAREEPGTRMAVRSVSIHGRGIDEYYLGQPLVVQTIDYDARSLRLGEPSPHADGKAGKS